MDTRNNFDNNPLSLKKYFKIKRIMKDIMKIYFMIIFPKKIMANMFNYLKMMINKVIIYYILQQKKEYIIVMTQMNY